MTAMNAEQWKRVSEIYTSALELPETERLGYIAAACVHDTAVESEIRRMMDTDTDTEGFLDRPLSLLGGILPEVTGFLSRLRPGEVVCDRFEIVRFLARGGMGEVYEAYDRTLHEGAALKTIRSDIAEHPIAAQLLKQEVRRARAIRSDHVCPVFDVFQDNSRPEPLIFLSMELLQGETLSNLLRSKGPLDPAEALNILRGIAAGLTAAHAEDVVHGDLKSGNIMLVPLPGGGVRATIMDFGLARKFTAQTPGAEGVEAAAGAGTPGYMAPEQAKGNPPGPWSDIYSLGVIAYEMVTGQLPFPVRPGERAAETPPPLSELVPEYPKAWERAIFRCLEPAPSDRFRSADEFIRALEGRRGVPVSRTVVVLLAIAGILGGGLYSLTPLRRGHVAAAPRNSVAILPFSITGGTEPGDYVGDGLTEEITHWLASSPELHVAGPDSAMRMKGSKLSKVEIARKLGVTYVVSGSIRRDGPTIRITAEMTRAPDGFLVWFEEYRRDAGELTALRSEIVRKIAGSLLVNVAGMQAPGTTRDLEARDLYWMGRHQWRQRTDAGVRRSVDFFERAIARDPSFAAGWAGLADAYAVMAERSMMPPAEALGKARDAARKAVALDPRLPEGWVSLGQVTSLYDRNFAEAERCFRRALDLKPDLSAAHQWYSYMLVKQRRFAEALDHARQAVAAEPLSLPANINLATLLYYARQDNEAVAQSRKLMELEPTLFFGHLIVAQLLAKRGQAEEAISEMQQVNEAARAHPLTVRFWAEMYAILGRRAEAEETIARLTAMRSQGRVPPFYIASAWATLGDESRAFEWLDIGLREHDGLMSMVHVAPGFDSLRGDPRYRRVIAELGITGETVRR